MLDTATVQQAVRVLIVDDNPDDAALCRRYLERDELNHYAISAVEMGDEAIRAIREDPPGCVLLDFHLPDMSALEVLDELGWKLGLIAVPVVVLTASDGDWTAREVIRRGAQQYILKEQLSSESLRVAITSAREQHRMGQELGRIQQRLALVVEASHDGIWDWDLEQDSAVWSNQIYTMLGLEPGAIASDMPSIIELTHPDDRERFSEAVRAHLEGGLPYRVELRLRRADGSYGWFLGTGKAARDDTGRPVRMAGSLTDITERRLSEEAVRASEQRYRALAEACGQIVWQSDPDGGNTFVDGSWTTLTGQTEDEVRGLGWLDAVHPDDREVAVAAWQHAVAHGERLCSELRVRARDGSYRHHEVRALPLKQADGSIREWIGVDIDITDFKHSEEALRGSRERLRLAIDAANLAVLELDLQTRVAQHDPSTNRLLGLPLDLTDHPLGALLSRVHPEDRAGFETELERSCQDGSTFQSQFRFTRPDGDERWISVVGQVIHDPAGRPVRIRGVAWDVTERTRLEHAQREFLAMAGHELKNPLAALKGNAQLMQRRGSYDERAVETIVAQADRLTRLVNDLQDASRADIGQFDLQLQDVNLVDLVRTALEEMGLTAPDRSLHLETLAERITGHWDPDRLVQILQNLLSNAIKYSEDSREIILRLEQRHDVARLCMIDHGPGIAPEVLPHLFDRYYRAQHGGTAEGLGLGLAITRALVGAHGGTISVESAPGQGSTFIVDLPCNPPA
ncbi:MAG: PAS domain-containing protein [Chloroflexota bacterium]